MLRIALLRGAASGLFTGAAGIGKVIGDSGYRDPSGGYFWPAMAVAAVSGVVAITVALITVLGPKWLERRAQRDPKIIGAKGEATDALVGELVRKERELQKEQVKVRTLGQRVAHLEGELADRDSGPHITPHPRSPQDVPGRRRSARGDDGRV